MQADLTNIQRVPNPFREPWTVWLPQGEFFVGYVLKDSGRMPSFWEFVGTCDEHKICIAVGHEMVWCGL